jgi:hypothetical protein
MLSTTRVVVGDTSLFLVGRRFLQFQLLAIDDAPPLYVC